MKQLTIKDNEEYLRQISSIVYLDDEALSENIKVLSDFCQENEVLAMAAVQLGISKRIIYLKNTNLSLVQKSQNDTLSDEEKTYNEAKVLINPIIVSKFGLTEYWEACASCMDLMGRVKRPYRIVIEYIDIEGNSQREVFEGFPATVLSHEMDHLDGILHIDIAEEVLDMPAEERKEFRKKHDYNIISKSGDYEKLKSYIAHNIRKTQ